MEFRHYAIFINITKIGINFKIIIIIIDIKMTIKVILIIEYYSKFLIFNYLNFSSIQNYYFQILL